MSVSFVTNNSQNNKAFKGKYKETENGVPYYSTNNGLKLGATIAGFTAVSNAVELFQKHNKLKSGVLENDLREAYKILGVDGKEIESNVKTEIEKITKDMKPMGIAKKIAIPVAVHLAGGLIYDAVRNNNAKKSAEYVNRVGANEALINDDKLDVSNNNHVYMKSKNGGKIGALTGLGIFGAACSIKYKELSETVTKIVKQAESEFKKSFENTLKPEDIDKMLKNSAKAGVVVVLAFSAIVSMLGGMLVGKIADHFTNKNARKNA